MIETLDTFPFKYLQTLDTVEQLLKKISNTQYNCQRQLGFFKKRIFPYACSPFTNIALEPLLISNGNIHHF